VSPNLLRTSDLRDAHDVQLVIRRICRGEARDGDLDLHELRGTSNNGRFCVTSERPPHVALKKITREFLLPGGGMRPAVKDSSLDVAAGAFVSIIGPSGSGKSTLRNIGGRDARGARDHAACMPQKDTLFP